MSIASQLCVFHFLAVFVLAAPFIAARRPNIVLVLTDDLDWTLGGANASTLQYTRQWFSKKNGILQNWFVHTPVCCPSRAQLMTGKMFHNLHTKHFGYEGCMHIDVTATPSSSFYARDYFAPHFAKLNYTVGIFGKHLNGENPTDFLPNGVDQWLINGGGNYLDPSFTLASRGNKPVSVTFDNCTEDTGMPCYSTSIIGNASLAWIQRHVTSSPLQPFFAIISVKAPHIQNGPGRFPKSIPAPWYKNATIKENKAPRTRHYNLSCPDHHWLVRSQPPLTQQQSQAVDQLYVSRLKTLLSVDDLMKELVSTLTKLKVLEDTIVLFTSDNGYRLGQYRMPQAKMHAYENDVRVPMMIRGPKVAPDVQIFGNHVDLIPTLLGIVNGDATQANIPPTMDGTNLAGAFMNHVNTSQMKKSMLTEFWSVGNVVRYEHLEDTYNHSFVALRIYDVQSNTNLKYVEYRDSQVDWNFTKPPLEVELFDLNKDKLEVHNLATIASPVLLQALRKKLRRTIQCQGEICRDEQSRALL